MVAYFSNYIALLVWESIVPSSTTIKTQISGDFDKSLSLKTANQDATHE